MANRRPVVETQLQTATSALQKRGQVLTEKKLTEKQRKRDPLYRKLEASIRKFKSRLKAMDKADAVNADVERRRAERLATPKVKKEKKKAVAAPKSQPKKEKKAKA